MTEEQQCTHRDVDREINLLHDAYDALRAMDRAGQLRALNWLVQRLEYDERQSNTLGKGTDDAR